MIRRLVLDRGGNTAVEFAILLPLLLGFVLGIVEFGRAMWIRQTLQYAAESASRIALADATLDVAAITAAVNANLPGLQGVTPVVAVATSSTQVSIDISYSFAFLVDGLLPFGPVTLTARSTLPR